MLAHMLVLTGLVGLISMVLGPNWWTPIGFWFAIVPALAGWAVEEVSKRFAREGAEQ